MIQVLTSEVTEVSHLRCVFSLSFSLSLSRRYIIPPTNALCVHVCACVFYAVDDAAGAAAPQKKPTAAALSFIVTRDGCLSVTLATAITGMRISYPYGSESRKIFVCLFGLVASHSFMIRDCSCLFRSFCAAMHAAVIALPQCDRVIDHLGDFVCALLATADRAVAQERCVRACVCVCVCVCVSCVCVCVCGVCLG